MALRQEHNQSRPTTFPTALQIIADITANPTTPHINQLLAEVLNCLFIASRNTVAPLLYSQEDFNTIKTISEKYTSQTVRDIAIRGNAHAILGMLYQYGINLTFINHANHYANEKDNTQHSLIARRHYMYAANYKNAIGAFQLAHILQNDQRALSNCSMTTNEISSATSLHLQHYLPENDKSEHIIQHYLAQAAAFCLNRFPCKHYEIIFEGLIHYLQGKSASIESQQVLAQYYHLKGKNFSLTKDGNNALAHFTQAAHLHFAIAKKFPDTHFSVEAYHHLRSLKEYSQAPRERIFLMLGECLINGYGVTQDNEKAIAYFFDAAKATPAEDRNENHLSILALKALTAIPEVTQLANRTLGYCYSNGYGVVRDRTIAKYYREASFLSPSQLVTRAHSSPTMPFSVSTQECSTTKIARFASTPKISPASHIQRHSDKRKTISPRVRQQTLQHELSLHELSLTDDLTPTPSHKKNKSYRIPGVFYKFRDPAHTQEAEKKESSLDIGIKRKV